MGITMLSDDPGLLLDKGGILRVRKYNKVIAIFCSVILLGLLVITIPSTKIGSLYIDKVSYLINPTNENLFEICNDIFGTKFVSDKHEYYPKLFALPMEESLKVGESDDSTLIPLRDLMLIDYIFSYFDEQKYNDFQETFVGYFDNFNSLYSLEYFIYKFDFSGRDETAIRNIIVALEKSFLNIHGSDINVFSDSVRNYNMRIFLLGKINATKELDSLTKERDQYKEDFLNSANK